MPAIEVAGIQVFESAFGDAHIGAEAVEADVQQECWKGFVVAGSKGIEPGCGYAAFNLWQKGQERAQAKLDPRRKTHAS